MAKFHPSENTLIEFSAGNLDWALSLCVSAHLEHCVECQKKVAEYNSLGAAYMSSLKKPQTVEKSFDALMEKIRQEEKAEVAEKAPQVELQTLPTEQRGKNLPKVVRKLLPDTKLNWKMVSPSLREAHLVTGQDKYQVSFHKIKRGGKVAPHDHRGLEVTLVLEGCFSDENGTYSVGDYLVKEPGECHRPMATQNEDCLCLSVVEAPVKLSGMLGKIINPFLKIRPA